MPENTSKAIMHVDAKWVNVDVLNTIPCPAPTNSWKPIPHAVFRQELHNAVAQHGYSVLAERWALSDAKKSRTDQTDASVYTGFGARCFGLIDVASHDSGYCFSIAGRSSLDKTLAIGVAAGGRVFICDNLALIGDVVQYRKHTSMLDIVAETRKAVEAVLNRGKVLAQFIDAMRAAPVNNNMVNAVLVDAALAGVLPGNTLQEIASAWRGDYDNVGDYVGFADRLNQGVYSDRNGWTLHNLWTETAGKRINPTSQGSEVFGRQQAWNNIMVKQLGLSTDLIPVVN